MADYSKAMADYKSAMAAFQVADAAYASAKMELVRLAADKLKIKLHPKGCSFECPESGIPGTVHALDYDIVVRRGGEFGLEVVYCDDEPATFVTVPMEG